MYILHLALKTTEMRSRIELQTHNGSAFNNLVTGRTGRVGRGCYKNPRENPREDVTRM